MSTLEISGARWRKSTRSAINGNCVEVADNLTDVVLVRDTKDQGTGPILALPSGAWRTFANACKAGEFSL